MLSERTYTKEYMYNSSYCMRCCCSLVAQSCLTHLDCSTPSFPVLHHFLELARTHVHWVSDAIQPSHLLSSPSPPVFYLSQHQGLFQWVGSLYQVTQVSELQLQHHPSNEYSALISFRIDWLDLLAVQGTLKSLLPAPQFESTNSSALSLLYSPTLTSRHIYDGGKSKQRLALAGDGRMGWGLIEKEHEGTFCGDSHAPYLNEGLDCKGGVLVCQNPGWVT